MTYEWIRVKRPFADRKSKEEIRAEILDHYVRGIVKIKDEKYTFVSGTSSYSLNHIPYVTTDSDIEIWGTLNGQRYSFTYNEDFAIAGKKIVWNTAKNNPDNGTDYYVTYKYQGTKSTITDENSIALVYTAAEAFANALDDWYDELVYTRYSHPVETATGESLEGIGALLGAPKVQAQKAEGNLTLTFTKSVTVGDPCTILSGDTFATNATRSEESIEFETVTGSTFTSGTSGIVGIKAVKAGKRGLVGANTITIVQGSISNLSSVINPSSTSIGADKEADTEYRKRLPLAIESKGKSTENAFLFDLTSLPDVAKVKVKNLSRGASTADIWVIADTLPMSSIVRSKVTNTINSGTALGIDIRLQEPKIINMWVSGTITRLKGSDSGDAFLWLSGETETYFNNLGLNERVRTQQWFGRLTDNNDVISIDSWTVNETGSTVVFMNNDDEIFRLGVRASPTGSSLSVFSEMESLTSTGNYETGWNVLLGKDTYDSGLTNYASNIYEITAVYDSGGNEIASTNWSLNTGAPFLVDAGATYSGGSWRYLHWNTGATTVPPGGAKYSVGYKYVAVSWDVTTTGSY